MLNLRQEAARSIVKDLAPFESAVDIAIARAGRFIATLAEGSIEAQVGPAPGPAAIMSALATVMKLGEARDTVVNTRRELVMARAKTGLREVAIGGLPGCPEMGAADSVGVTTTVAA